MIDLLAELYDLNALTTIYTGISLGIALKFLLIWGTNFSFADFNRPVQPARLHFSGTFQIESRQNFNFILMWIGKSIRKKTCTSDDTDSHCSSLTV